ncbi:unnamed protein product [Rhizoctonia solani]|uniref:Uncharacterized protein n=1 Tax=Rhizoctonia solani TaxID=456999 RepID=A0A8H3H6S4_9AGAM|nr:unnamed protein product [Rhizoctonia solani]
MPAKRTNSPSAPKKSEKPYDKPEKTLKDERVVPTLKPSTSPNWQARYQEWSNHLPEGEKAKRCIDKWCLLPPYDHSITEDQWELYYKERSALDGINTFGSDASSSVLPRELRPPLRVLEDASANLAATIYGSVLAEASKIAIARTLRGSLYITEADGQEGWQAPGSIRLLESGPPLTLDIVIYSFDYRESDFFGLLVAISNGVGDIDVENPGKCKALEEDGSPRPESVEVFAWNGGNTVGAATATEISSFEPTLFGSTSWLSPLKLHNLLLAASTCSHYDDIFQELELGIEIASSRKFKFFEGETAGDELSSIETSLYKKLRQQMLGREGDGLEEDDDDQPGCVPERLLLLARHK